MTEQVAALNVRLEATLARFERQMRQGRRTFAREAGGIERRAGRLDNRLKRVGDDFGKTLERRVGRVLAVGAATAGIVALGRAARASAGEMAALGDAADRASFDPEAFERIKAAITLDGQDASGLEKGLISLTRKMIEAEQGSKIAKDAFAALNVDIAAIQQSGAGSEEVLRQIADGMQTTSDKTEILNASMVLFGRAGGTMNAVLAKGSDALESQFQEAEQLGLLYGGDLLRNTQAVNAELDIQAQIVDVKLNKAFVSLAPLVSDATSLFADFAETVGRGYVRLMAFIGLQRGPLDQQLSKNITELRDVQNQLADMSMNGPGFMDRSFNSRLQSLRTREMELTNRNQDLSGRLDSLNQPAPTLPTLPSLPRVPRGSSRGSGGGGRSNARNDRTGANLIARLTDELRGLREENDLIGKQDAQRAKLSAAFGREAVQREILIASKRDGATVTVEEIILAQNLASEIERQTVANFELEAAYEAEMEAAKDAKQAQEDLARSISDVGDEILGTIQNAKSFKDVLLGLLPLIGRTALGQGPLGGAFSDLIGSAGGGLIGLLSSNSTGMSLSAGTTASSLPAAFADGGAFRNGGPISYFRRGGTVVNQPSTFPMGRGVGMMAEAGPEAIMPLERGPDGKLGVASSGGGGNTINLSVTNNVSGLGLSAPQVQDVMERNNRNIVGILDERLNSGA